jgi:hypothetical protein
MGLLTNGNPSISRVNAINTWGTMQGSRPGRRLLFMEAQ